VDFEHQRREVIQYIYRKYGRDRAALAASLITYRSRSALRDGPRARHRSGVVEQVVKGQAGGMAARRSSNGSRYGLDPDSPAVQQWASLTEQLRGFPRHLSQHVGGFVIARASCRGWCRSRTRRWRTQRDPVGQGRPRIAGLLKVDVLALGMLTAIRRALAMIPNPEPERAGLPTRMEDLPETDDATYDMICRPIRWACSRSNRARSSRCCRACSRASTTTWWWKWPSCGPARSRAAWCIPI
jgi:error-prone DNA polymerase